MAEITVYVNRKFEETVEVGEYEGYEELRGLVYDRLSDDFKKECVKTALAFKHMCTGPEWAFGIRLIKE